MLIHISCVGTRRSVSVEVVGTLGIGAGIFEAELRLLQRLLYWAKTAAEGHGIICLKSVDLESAFSESAILQFLEELSRSILGLCIVGSVDLWLMRSCYLGRCCA